MIQGFSYFLGSIPSAAFTFLKEKQYLISINNFKVKGEKEK